MLRFFRYIRQKNRRKNGVHGSKQS
jgi:hypothetical protein